MTTSNPTHLYKTTLCTYICSIIQIQSISLQNIINYSTVQIVRRILICSSVRSACTRKIVLKHEFNELNEPNECILYKMFCFFGKHLKTVEFSCTIYFPEALLAYFALLALKVSKTFLKSLACLLYLALL